MLRFVYDSLPGRIVFGAGSLDQLPDEVARLGALRALILCSPGQRRIAERAAARLGPQAAGIYDEIVMHVPIEAAEAGRAAARRVEADCCIALGGGSTIGLAKAIALELGLPIIAVPTTYAGSEMTPILGMTEHGVKRTLRERKVLPRTVIYDPELTLSLPAAIAGPSGMNALAHCVEALYAADANPITSLIAEEGIRALGRSLPVVVARPGDLAARADALYGAWLAGAALGAVAMALHHKLCHVLGGSFDLPHAEVHTVILPHATAYNRAAAPEAMARIAQALGVADAAAGLFDLAVAVGARTSLAALGLPATALDRAADLAVQNPYDNPRPVTREGVRALLDDAWHGRRPAP
jgi:maleylacetate reductase